MANYLSNTSGNFSTAGTWDTIVNTPTIHATTNISVSTSGIFSATFTAPNLVNASTGAAIFMVTRGTPTSWTATLQEDIAGAGAWLDTAATATITTTNLPVITSASPTWVNFKWGTPYVYATTGANRYRIKLQVSSTTGTPNVGADSGGSLFAYLTTDNANVAPGANDLVFIMGNNGTNVITVTVDGTANSVGAAESGNGTARGFYAVTISNGGVLTWDVAASSLLTVKGHVISYAGGTLYMGRTATPVPEAQYCSLTFNENGTTGRYGLLLNSMSVTELSGAPKSSTSLWKTTWVSGTGTAASPLVTADAVNWSVNDNIVVGMNTSGTLDLRYIITKNSSTSYVVSNTLGGAENALSAHQTTSRIVNLTRNVIITTTSSTYGTWVYNATGGTAATGTFNAKWAMILYGSWSSTNGAFSAWSIRNADVSGTSNTLDYCVMHTPTINNTSSFRMQPGITASQTFNGLVAYAAPSVGLNSFNITGANMTLNDCIGYNNFAAGFKVDNGALVGAALPNYGNTFNRCIMYGSTGSGTSGGCFHLTEQYNNNYNDCEAQGGSTYGVLVDSVTLDTKFTNFKGGTIRINAAGDVGFSNGGTTELATLVFVNPTCSSSTLVGSYTTRSAPGTVIAFQKLNGTENNNIWYSATGTARATGAGLVDTNTHTSGKLSLRIAPENVTSGFIVSFLTPARVGKYAYIAGFAQLNAAFTADASSSCVVDLYLPGSTTPDASATILKTTNSWQTFAVAALYAGAVDLYATVRITVKTTTASAYAYFADFYNGTNTVTDLSTWYNGQPSSILFEQLGDAQANWAVLTSTLTTASTVGKLVVDMNTNVSDIETAVSALPTAGSTADAVWDEATSGHTTTGTYGKKVKGLQNPSIILDGEIVG